MAIKSKKSALKLGNSSSVKYPMLKNYVSSFRRKLLTYNDLYKHLWYKKKHTQDKSLERENLNEMTPYLRIMSKIFIERESIVRLLTSD